MFVWLKTFIKVHFQLCSNILGLWQPISHKWFMYVRGKENPIMEKSENSFNPIIEELTLEVRNQGLIESEENSRKTIKTDNRMYPMLPRDYSARGLVEGVSLSSLKSMWKLSIYWFYFSWYLQIMHPWKKRQTWLLKLQSRLCCTG